jgi:TPP-dependent indolepyruvate ferredoxin oxidoreductase alpha subunit
MTDRLTDDTVNAHDARLLRIARLAYRLGRLDQQRFVEHAVRKQLDNDVLATLLHGLAADFPHEPVDYSSIVHAAEGDSTRLTEATREVDADGLFNNRPIPLCERCGHKATMHVTDDEERRECMEWSCGCEQFVALKDGGTR